MTEETLNRLVECADLLAAYGETKHAAFLHRTSARLRMRGLTRPVDLGNEVPERIAIDGKTTAFI